MNRILLFGAGKSATSLISYLVAQAKSRDWQLVVADNDLSLAGSKIGTDAGERATAVAIQVEDEEAREALVRQASIVISLLPPALHFLVARSCLKWKKDLLTASYLDEKIRALEPAIKDAGLLFLCEMGLDPGIDHMSAMDLIHRIHREGGKIRSFRSHTGGLVAPESDDNPWHYKISWNPRNVVLAGSSGATYKEHGRVVALSYPDLFTRNEEVNIPGLGALAWYPNRDSLSYIPVYGLGEADSFVRTTLRHPSYCRAWGALVKAGLTNDQLSVERPPQGLSFAGWSSSLSPFIDEGNRTALQYLGLFDQARVPDQARTSADILQYLLETRLAMRPDDKDMIVMLHEIGYENGEDGPEAPRHKTRSRLIRSHLIVKGEDSLRTAMAKTVGLPLGIAATLMLEGRITLTGLHIPILPAIYEPVLKELAKQGIRFEEGAG
ncbi:MAG: saccharopine dehydrogenase C-terminal domain-containing protein [Bacteroidota bacterium]|nr:saccharopine dehydrogenase C-terminal domain-containing protein [Bacteroidota bacterium]MDP4247536.1 saccharopine dehydrogenase C-terminal domain-containing protein [Bacteroidota bacterium]MDP4252724.1 saccharopine dehydrogenase C-terminal domain-containing protein [Bacteroidota bacterium]MDP4260464.1 saccharopine dehydrogenase C-terminal domain-containing protein [Bacteroidota bacterium]